MLFRAVWSGDDRSACVAEQTGACWAFIRAKLPQLLLGFYPVSERWRPVLLGVLCAATLVPILMPGMPGRRVSVALFCLLLPIGGVCLLHGGVAGLPVVPTKLWGGLMITLLVALVAITASIPLGIVLALGRRSTLSAVRLLSAAFIEFWRGVPLVTVLFFAVYVLPLFMPSSWALDGLLRVLIGISLFASAYMAEVVRGGLQSVHKGQLESARALGFGYWPMMRLVILPQAIRHVIPGIVNTFIMLFKDTTLVLIVSILDLLGQLRAAQADPHWATPTTEITGLAFAGLIYFAFCFSMSAYSRFLARELAWSNT